MSSRILILPESSLKSPGRQGQRELEGLHFRRSGFHSRVPPADFYVCLGLDYWPPHVYLARECIDILWGGLIDDHCKARRKFPKATALP